jgi:hypothetical protein
MYYPISNRALVQRLVASALILAGAGACSQSDRSESGSTSAAVGQDTTFTGGRISGSTDTATTTTGADTMTATGTATGAAGDTTPARIQANAPRATPSAESGDTSLRGDSATSGYRAMDRDTATVPDASDSARVNQDTSEVSQNTTDTASVETAGAVTADTDISADAGAAVGVGAADTAANAGRVRPPEDSTEILGQVNTDTTAEADVSANADVAVGAETQDTADNAGRIRPPEDSSEISGQDSTAFQTGVEMARDTTAADQADTSSAAADVDASLQASVDTTPADAQVTADAGVSANADVTTDTSTTVATADTISDRVRSPEDSTEVWGNVNSADTADEAPVAAAEQDSVDYEPEVAAAETRADSVGAAPVSVNVTGSEAVEMVSRQDARCSVVDPESDAEVRWDMSSTPVTLNPCGLGSMNLSKVETETER